MSATGNCTSIGSLVDEYLISAGYEGRQNYPRLLTIAIRGLKEIHYDVTGATVWSRLELDENQRLCIPQNAIKLIAFFMPSGDGLVPIAKDTQSSRSTLDGSGSVHNTQVSGDQDIFNKGYMWADTGSYDAVAKYWQNGQFKGGVYSGGGGNPYTYVINDALGKVEFSSNVPRYVIAQYLSDPNQVNGKYVVHPMVADAILQYIWYADNRFKQSVSEGAKAEMQRKYVTAKTFAHMRLISQSAGDLKDSRSKGISLTSK